MYVCVYVCMYVCMNTDDIKYTIKTHQDFKFMYVCMHVCMYSCICSNQSFIVYMVCSGHWKPALPSFRAMCSVAQTSSTISPRTPGSKWLPPCRENWKWGWLCSGDRSICRYCTYYSDTYIPTYIHTHIILIHIYIHTYINTYRFLIPLAWQWCLEILFILPRTGLERRG